MKSIKTNEFAKLINDGDTIATNGFVGAGVPESLLCELEKTYYKMANLIT